jgi:non-ribosomal peptide synthetase component E (peptide arylation enzyme)
VVKEGRRLSLANITRHLESVGLARQKFPERLELLEALPMNAAGKIRKIDLRRLFSTPDQETERVTA